jgi:hypothetical protein
VRRLGIDVVATLGLREVSALTVCRGPDGPPHLLAVGDEDFAVVSAEIDEETGLPTRTWRDGLRPALHDAGVDLRSGSDPEGVALEGKLPRRMRRATLPSLRQQQADTDSPSASGGPAETNFSPHSSCSRATRSVSCSSLSPVIASYPNSSSPILARCLRTPNKTGRAVAPQARHAPVSISRSSRELPPRHCGQPTEFGL